MASFGVSAAFNLARRSNRSCQIENYFGVGAPIISELTPEETGAITALVVAFDTQPPTRRRIATGAG